MIRNGATPSAGHGLPALMRKAAKTHHNGDYHDGKWPVNNPVWSKGTFNDDPSWDFAWVRLGTNGTSFFFDFEFTETPDNGPQVVAVALHGPQPAVGGSAFGISSH